jgi:hypothetical protein
LSQKERSKERKVYATQFEERPKNRGGLREPSKHTPKENTQRRKQKRTLINASPSFDLALLFFLSSYYQIEAAAVGFLVA